MKLVFPILRLNWYRLLSPVIDEALRRGHEVECWHNEDGTNWPSNTPSFERVPKFINGKPVIRTYASTEALKQMYYNEKADAVISLSLPSVAGLDGLHKVKNRPCWVVLPTPDTTHDLDSLDQIMDCDLFLHRTSHTRDCVITDHTLDCGPFLEEALRGQSDQGNLYVQRFSRRKECVWNPACVDAYRARCVVTGYPLFDSLKLMDRTELRNRWGLPLNAPVVGLLSAPYAGRGFSTEWERIFASPDPVRFRYRNWQNLGWRGALKTVVNEPGVVKGIHQFCRRNDAALITKRRHYQAGVKAGPYERYSDYVIGEEDFYPHSALQMAVAADIVVGFFTTGTSETVAAGGHMIDVIVPGAPRELHKKYASIFDGMFHFPGAATSMNAIDIMHKISSLDCSEFSVREEARKQYNDKFNGPVDGLHSQRALIAVEHLVDHRDVQGVAVDEHEFVRI